MMKQVCNFLASERISPECNLEQRENERERVSEKGSLYFLNVSVFSPPTGTGLVLSVLLPSPAMLKARRYKKPNWVRSQRTLASHMKEFYNYEAVVVALRLAELGHDQEAPGSILATSKLFYQNLPFWSLFVVKKFKKNNYNNFNSLIGKVL